MTDAAPSTATPTTAAPADPTVTPVVATPVAMPEPVLGTPVADPAAPAAPAPTEPYDFRSHLAPEFKDHTALKDLKDVNALAKSYVHMAQRMGNALYIPGEGASEADKTAFQTKINEINGVPEKPENYVFTPPEDVPAEFIDEQMLGAFKDTFHKSGIGAKQAQQVVSEYITKEHQRYIEFQTKTLTDLQTEWGPKFEERLNKTKLFAQTYMKGTTEDAQKRYYNDPVFIRMVDNIVSKSAEDKFLGGDNSSPTGAVSKDSLRQRAVTLMQDPAYKDSLHPQHDAKVNEVNELYKKMSSL